MKKNVIGLLFFLLCLLLGATLVFAQENTKEKLQASLLYHFAKHIEWANHKQTGLFTIGFVGHPSFKLTLQETVKNRLIGKQRVVVLEVSSLEELQQCHIVFVQNSFSVKFTDLNEYTKKHNVLLVTEEQDPTKVPTGINFFTQSGKLRFSLNKLHLESIGLKVSSDLVRLSESAL